MCRCVSIIPGITMPPEASISCAPSGASRPGPTPAILSSTTSTSLSCRTSWASFIVSTVPRRRTTGRPGAIVAASALIRLGSLCGLSRTFPSAPGPRQAARGGSTRLATGITMPAASFGQDVGPTTHVAAPPELVGREPELEAVRAFVDGLEDGPRGLLIEGEAGIGKTAIWRAAVAEAEARGCVVLRCVAEQAEARLSFVGLADLAEDISDACLAAVRSPQREALEVALVRRERAGEPPDPAAVAIGFRSLLVRIAEAAPVVVAVDDVQWLDAATTRALAFAVRRLEGQRVGILATARAPLPGPEPLGLERALGPERLARVRLGPLDVDAVRRLIESALGYGFPRPTLLRIAQAAGGNPLFAFEIARALGPAPALE